MLYQPAIDKRKHIHYFHLGFGKFSPAIIVFHRYIRLFGITKLLPLSISLQLLIG